MKKIWLLSFFVIATGFCWEKSWSFGVHHQAFDLIELSDSSIVFVGRVQQSYPSAQFTVARFNPNGDTLWIKFFGQPGEESCGYAIIQISDTSFVVSGTYSNSLLFIACMSFAGDSIWARTDNPATELFGGYGRELEVDLDGNIISSLGADSKGFSLSGERLWSRRFEGLTEDIGSWLDMKVVNMEPFGYVVAGYHDVIPGPGSSVSGLIIFYDEFGDTLWLRHYGESEWDLFYDIEVIDNPAPGYPSGFIAVGVTRTTDSSMISPGFIVRTDIDGNVVWSKLFMHPWIDPETGGGVEIIDIEWAGNEPCQTRFTILGNMERTEDSERERAWIAVISDTLDGDTLWTKTFDHYTAKTYGHNIVRCVNGDYVMSGILQGGEWASHIWLCRVDSLGNDVPYAIEEPHVPATTLPEQLEVSVFPNPFNSTCEINIPPGFTVSIYDVYGRCVYTLPVGSATWNADGQPSGVYLVRARKGEVVVEKRVVLVK